MRRFLLMALLMLIIISALIILLVPRLDALLSRSRSDGPRIGLGDDMYKAEVFEIIEEGSQVCWFCIEDGPLDWVNSFSATGRIST